MRIVPSSIDGVALHGPDSQEFSDGLTSLLGRAPRELLEPALPFSVIVANHSERTVSLLGVRFDMVGPHAKEYSVVHFADTLRNPQKADFRPGTKRFVCAEPAYTALVVRGEVAANTRGRMNLGNLRRMLQIRATLDCIAFDDGLFAGPDSQGSFERFAREREIEAGMVADVLALEGAPLSTIEDALVRAIEDVQERARRAVARKLLEALARDGRDEMFRAARTYRHRIALRR